jgi:predicted Zn-dependent protease
MKRIIFFRLPQAALVMLFLLLSACATNPVTGKKQIMLISEAQEIEMGKEYHPQVLSQFGVYPDSTLQRFIRAKGQAMAKISHRPNLPWTFTIVDSPVVNAFAVPGGYIYFTRGIMAHFNNEAQFAGVLGHEIGHVTARHSASQQSKAALAQVGMVAGMVISPEFAQLADVAGQGLQLLFLKFSRDDESQADRLGVEYSTMIGFNAHEMADFFNTLDRLGGDAADAIPTFLSTHPNPEDRFARVHELADDWQNKLNKTPERLEVNRDDYLRIIDGIVYGEDPRQGYFENNYFYHPELKFQFPVPAGWKTQNTPAQVTMVTSDQKAGLILRHGQGQSPQDAAQTTVRNFQIQTVESGASTVNGLSAYRVIGDITDEQSQQTLRVLIYEIQYGDPIYEFIGFSNRNTFNNYLSTFLNTTEGFRQLTDPARLNVQPERLSIREVPRDMSFTEAMGYFNVPGDRYEEFAILNGMELEQRLDRGSLVKVAGK